MGIDLTTDLEAEMKHIYNPSKLSTISPSFWKWSALVVAVFTLLACVIAKFQQSIRQTRMKSSVSCRHQVYEDDDDLDYEFSDEDVDTPLAASESDDEEEYQKPAGEVFRSEGSDAFEASKFSWLEFPSGKNVVQVWDGFGLGFNSDYRVDAAIWDFDISSRWCSKDPTMVENVVVTADGDVGLGGHHVGKPSTIWGNIVWKRQWSDGVIGDDKHPFFFGG